MGCGPREVIVEFVAAGKKGFKVDKVLQPLFLMEIVDECKVTGGIPQRGQILQEGNLHMRIVQHHVWMPGETRLFLDKKRVYVVSFLFLFLQGNSKRNVGGAKADTDQIMYLHSDILRIKKMWNRMLR